MNRFKRVIVFGRKTMNATLPVPPSKPWERRSPRRVGSESPGAAIQAAEEKRERRARLRAANALRSASAPRYRSGGRSWKRAR